MPRIILMGPPGSGKGTQGEILASLWHVPRIAPGDIFRAEVKNDTELGRQVKAFSAAGKLVPDEVAIAVMRSRLSQPDAACGWILDGFPRTIPQAEALDRLLADMQQRYDAVVNLDVPEEVLLPRLRQRAVEQGRADDTDEVIRERLREYQQKTKPLLKFYADCVIQIDGTPALEIVTQSIKSKVAV